jgi:hypothetical protein
MRRLDKAAKYCGQTRQAFVMAAVLAEIAEVEERQRMKQLRGSRNNDGLQSEPREIDTSAAPTGLGIASAIRQRQEATTPIEEPAPQRQVVVNVGNNGSGGATGSGDAIDRLASYVVTGNEFERDMRLRTAVSILKTSAATEEERNVLAARLDEVIATKTTTKKNESGGVVRAARVAFDKIAGLLGGDE